MEEGGECAQGGRAGQGLANQLDSTLLFVIGTAASIVVAAGAWLFAWSHTHRTNKRERLNAKRETIYVTAAMQFVHIFVEIKKSNGTLTQKQIKDLTDSYALNLDFRRNQINLILYASDEVIPTLRWASLTDESDGYEMLRCIAEMLHAMRKDLMDETKKDLFELMAVIMEEDADALRELLSEKEHR